MSAGVTVTPWLDGELGLDGAVDQLLERERVDLLQPLVEQGVWRLSASAALIWPAASRVRIRRFW